jgi:hypothetical protein
MYRRAFLPVFVGGVFAAAGCLETDQQPSNNRSDAYRSRTISSEGITAELRVTNSFMRSSTKEDAAANFNSTEVVIHGIYRPPTACHTLSLAKFEQIENEAVRLTVSQVKENGDSEGVCEGAYVVYRIAIRGSNLPSSIRISHSQSGRSFELTESNPGTLPQMPENTAGNQNPVNRSTEE